LGELVGRARAKAVAPRLRDIGVVELSLQPQLRGQLSLALALDRDTQPAGGIFCHVSLYRHSGARARTRVYPSSIIRLSKSATADVEGKPGIWRRGARFPLRRLRVAREWRGRVASQRAVFAHHFDQHALAQAAVGDAEPRQRKGQADGVEDGAAG